jgi:hypothetical protein
MYLQSLPQGISKPPPAPGVMITMPPATSQGVPIQTIDNRPSNHPAPMYMPAMWTDPLAKYRDYTIQHTQLQQMNNQHFLHAVVDPITGTSMEYRH